MNLEERIAEIIRTELKSALRELIPEIAGLVAKETDNHTLKYLTRKQAALYLGISLPCLDNWARTGRLNKIKIYRSVRFGRQEIDAKLETLKKYSR